MFNFLKLPAFFRREPADPFDRAVRRLERGAPDDAEVALSALLEGVSGVRRAAILNKRGVCRIRLNRRAQARADFEAALAADARFAPAIVNLGNLLLEDGEVSAAIAHYEFAIRCDDTYALGHLNLSAAYKRAGRHAEAVREFRRANRLGARRAL